MIIIYFFSPICFEIEGVNENKVDQFRHCSFRKKFNNFPPGLISCPIVDEGISGRPGTQNYNLTRVSTDVSIALQIENLNSRNTKSNKAKGGKFKYNYDKVQQGALAHKC